MHAVRAKLLIADDEASIRTSLSLLSAEFGHSVRTVVDGFSALSEIRREVPDILLSDLNMPGMSGFELLSVVRRRYPQIFVVAMSGAFSGNAVPFGVAADAFYQKGGSMGSLLKLLDNLPVSDRVSPENPTSETPMWIQRNGDNSKIDSHVMVACPECLRVFPQILGCSTCLVQEARCSHCKSLIHFAIVHTAAGAYSKALKVYPHDRFAQGSGPSELYY